MVLAWIWMDFIMVQKISLIYAMCVMCLHVCSVSSVVSYTGLGRSTSSLGCVVYTSCQLHWPRLETTPLSLGKETGQVTINDSTRPNGMLGM